MNSDFIGRQISDSRKKLGMTQAELADKCHLNIRTIQRIESGHTSPRFFTLNIINEVLGTNFEISFDREEEVRILNSYKASFRKRKIYRIVTFSIAIFIMIAVFILAFPSWELFGMPKLVWAPFFYLIMFAHLIGIGILWRCPACNGLLGDVFNSRYCSKCGFHFYD